MLALVSKQGRAEALEDEEESRPTALENAKDSDGDATASNAPAAGVVSCGDTSSAAEPAEATPPAAAREKIALGDRAAMVEAPAVAADAVAADAGAADAGAAEADAADTIAAAAAGAAAAPAGAAVAAADAGGDTCAADNTSADAGAADVFARAADVERQVRDLATSTVAAGGVPAAVGGQGDASGSAAAGEDMRKLLTVRFADSWSAVVQLLLSRHNTILAQYNAQDTKQNNTRVASLPRCLAPCTNRSSCQNHEYHVSVADSLVVTSLACVVSPPNTSRHLPFSYA